MARARTWTDEQLRTAVCDANTWAEVSRRLGLPAPGKTTRGTTVGITNVQHGLTESPSSGKYSGRRPYTKAEIDLFFIFTGTGALYLIPIDAVEGMRHLALERYAKYRLPELIECSYSNVAERSARDAGC